MFLFRRARRVLTQYFHLYFIVKLLDWGEDGMATTTETAALRASFKQEVSVWQKLDHPNVTRVNISNLLHFCLDHTRIMKKICGIQYIPLIIF